MQQNIKEYFTYRCSTERHHCYKWLQYDFIYTQIRTEFWTPSLALTIVSQETELLKKRIKMNLKHPSHTALLHWL